MLYTSTALFPLQSKLLYTVNPCGEEEEEEGAWGDATEQQNQRHLLKPGWTFSNVSEILQLALDNGEHMGRGVFS